MKTFYIFFLLIFILIGCNSSEETGELTNTTNQQLGEPVNTTKKTNPNKYQEFHENGALSIEGQFNQDKLRHGLWTSYYENGIKWSEIYYVNGKKHGHSITFYPNGKPRYIGEYQNDEKTGEWTFYNEKGEKINGPK